ncbi:MAG: GNAT family N-acetyltransferase [Candidatus Thermofonsia Clade 3 bacterium]|jgi:GNAT superfamily N-acetyltransferase|uniref:GNAT family N-acetyltransferase n=1 Tax=Candidatus Thermofonsia Clade 3 bacterium TaxID=2364212 RepID=A0A2M8Q9K8_9CHLR|nr:GNAT family N-acetyltransferase [Candidatus Roseilinea sp. NK_OTU-006]PJF46481.1 MAG: GNAT family N-acetyltransferase [Candidatus Thermofonsia Clade 3 bacterium]
MSDLVIARFTPADQPEAQALILAGMEERWGALDPSLNPDLNDIAKNYAGGIFLVARWEGQLVGTGALLPEGERTGRIVRMSVARSHRCRGIGARILQALLDEARSRGYRTIVLETTETWDDAIAFYLKHGFRIVARRDGEVHFALTLA